MIYNLGPKAQHIFEALRHSIQSGKLVPGTQLPSHTELAAEYRVAPLTIRSVLAKLEEEGWVSREQGRGTFVRTRATPAVMIVDDDPQMVSVLSLHVRQAGYRPVTFNNPAEALRALAEDNSIVLVLSDIRMPAKELGIEFIRAVRRRWPRLPLAVLTGYPEDLIELHGTPEWPILILAKPVFSQQIEEALRLSLPKVALTPD
jgi:DNA-binding transcriptional regulator YhcF (GntR family)